MSLRILPAAVKKMDRKLKKHVLLLSKDTIPERFSPITENTDHDTLMRRRAEDSFQHALCTRIWWRLTPEERKSIAKEALQDDPYMSEHALSLEFACENIVQQLLDDARQHA